MNPSPAPVVTTLDRLSIGIARVSIRHASTGAPRFRKKNYAWTGFERGHGESIYVFTHSQNGMIIYSHDPVLKPDSQKALSQIPFTVKKQKPAVLRPDYWHPLCMIRFARGRGDVGRSVFQKLREFRKLHELSWGWQTAEFQRLSRRERGERIHNQKPNAIADIAAVLGGVGRGSLMWTTEPVAEPVAETVAEAAAAPAEENAAVEAAKEVEAEVEVEKREEAVKEEGASASEAAPPSEGAAETEATKAAPAGPEKRLMKADIYWANDIDINWARKWSDNVQHHVGLPDGVKVWNWKTKILVDPEAAEKPEEVEEDAEGEGEKTSAGEANAKDAEGKDEGTEEKKVESEPEPEPKQDKKGWLGWLSGKSGSSSQDART